MRRRRNGLLNAAALLRALAFVVILSRMTAADEPKSEKPQEPPAAGKSEAKSAEEPRPTEAESPNPAAESAKSTTLEEAKKSVAEQVEITIGMLEGRLKQANELKGLAEDVKKRIIADYQRAIDLSRLGQDWNKKAKQFEKDALEAPAQIEKLKKDTVKPTEEIQLGNTSERSLADLEKLALEAEAKVEDIKKQQARWENEPKRRADRRTDIGKLTAAAREKLDQLVKEIEAKAPSKDASEAARAQRSALYSQRYALEQELDCYERELRYYEASAELPNLLRDAATQELNRLTRTAKALRSLVLARRTAEAERAEERARIEAENLDDTDVDPQLRRLAIENSQFARSRTEIVDEVATVDAKSQKVDEQLKRIRDAFASVQEKIKVGGMTQVNGVLLRQLREKLPDVRQPRRDLRRLQQTIADTQLRTIELQQEREHLADFGEEVHRIVAKAEIVPADRLDYETEIKRLLTTRKEYIGALLSEYEKYLLRLSNLDGKCRRLIDETEKIAAAIRDRILWIRSSQPFNGSEWSDAKAAANWLFSVENWYGVAIMLKTDAAEHPYLMSAAALAFVCLNVLRGWLRRVLKACGEQAVKPASTSFGPTFRALIVTTLVSLVGPMPIWFLSWRLMVCLDRTESEFASALSDGLFAVGLPLMALEFFRQICRDKGLAESHFGWKPRALQLIRGALRAMILAGMPIIFLVEMIESSNRSAYANSLGRFLLILGLALLAYFAHRLFNPKTGVFKHIAVDPTESWVVRLRRPFYAIAFGLPLALAVFAALGYYYTALQLTVRIKSSLWIGLASLVAHGLMLRWLLLARRRMAFEQARKRREQQAEAREADSGAELAHHEPGLDISTINAQTRNLLRSFMGLAFCIAMWVVWADVVPAEQWLSKITIWNATVKVNENIASPDKAPEMQTIEKIVPITLFDLLKSALIVAATLAASRNVPGLMEISILQRLPLDAGGRYAITTVCRYVITILGMVAAFGAIGIGWSNVQWLAAAMTVGLGFGLQEIFANFVSGLILLLERPIRVGDTVTVGDVTGVVTRIRIRATTITDADRKELVVPNKEFITGKLMNWTLSDPTLRIMVRVNVAYGSQPDAVLSILERVGRNHPQVLRDPPPQSFFEGFNENTLSFSLRAFVPSIDILGKVRHELHLNVDRALREANIDPSSSHYDVYIRSLPKVEPGTELPADVAGIISSADRRQSA